MKVKILLLLLGFKLIAQQNNAPVKIEYSETIIYTPTIINYYTATLFVQNEYSYYKTIFQSREKVTQNVDDSDKIMINTTEKEFDEEVFIDKKAKQLTENKNEDIFLKKPFSIVETLPVIKWTLLKGEKKFNNMTCKKAKTTFRGRTYNVWYTEKIPVSAGPWKLHGLPGLILLAEDAEGIYKWEVKNIKYPFKENKIDLKETYLKRVRYKKLTYREFDNKFIEAVNTKIKIVRSRYLNKESRMVSFAYNTLQHKEPVNEWRTQTQFK